MWKIASAITSGNLEPNEETGRHGMKTSGYSQRLENMSLAVGLIGLPILLAPSAYAVPDSQESALPVQKSSSSLWDQQYMFGEAVSQLMLRRKKQCIIPRTRMGILI